MEQVDIMYGGGELSPCDSFPLAMCWWYHETLSPHPSIFRPRGPADMGQYNSRLQTSPAAVISSSEIPAPRLCSIYLRDVLSLFPRRETDQCRQVSAHLDDTFNDYPRTN